MTERNYQILKKTISRFQEVIKVQMKKLVFKIIVYAFIV
jgi:uncharacterized protein YlaN (UPF0358 family)